MGLVREKLLVDPKRFSVNRVRTVPQFPPYNQTTRVPTTDCQRSLTILYLLHYFYPSKKGGTERFTLNLAKEQLRIGNRPMVLVLEANEPMSIYTERCGGIVYRHYEYDGILCIAFRHRRAPLGLYYKDVRTDDEELRAFAEHLLGIHRFDVVHATYPQPFASFLLRCKEIGIPYGVTCTDFCMMCHYATMVDDNGAFCAGTEGQTKCALTCPTYGCSDFTRRHQNAEQVLSEAAFVTVPSEFVARVMGQEFPSITFSVVAHGISESFSYSERQGPVKRFVYAGTLTALKGVHLLVSAFCALSDKTLTLDIYGDGDETYVSQLHSLSDERVRFHGAVPGSEMPHIYSESDCVIVPSMWYETYNFVLREALATGALVLASDIGAMSEAVDEEKNGFLFVPADEADLKRQFERVLQFDFAQYQSRRFPTTAEEGQVYNQFYHSAIEQI